MNLAKLILIVRDPIDRLVSDYLQIKEKLESENRTVGTLEHLAIKDGKARRYISVITEGFCAVNIGFYLQE